jgi:hypothetical protein
LIYTVSVEQALKIGKKRITYVSGLLFFGILFITIYLLVRNILHPYHFITGFIIASFLSLLNWSLKITSWKIWAFTNVRNIHELKKKAIRENLLYNDNSIWNRTAISTTNQKKEWIEIEKRFKTKDYYEDNLLIPEERNFYISKTLQKYDLIKMILLIVFGCIVVYYGISGGIFLIIIGLISAFFITKKLYSDKVLLSLNIIGIKTNGENMIKWHEIIDTNIVRKGSKNKETYLILETKFEAIEINIEELEIDNEELEELINTYRLRNENKNKTSHNSGFAQLGHKY